MINHRMGCPAQMAYPEIRYLLFMWLSLSCSSRRGGGVATVFFMDFGVYYWSKWFVAWFLSGDKMG
jgi:hypothetical protein